MATTYYAHGDTGDDLNDGLSPTTPVRTLATLVLLQDASLNFAGTAAGDIINLAGTFREPLKICPPGSGLTIQQWSGNTQCVIRGDTVMDKNTMTTPAADVYRLALPAGTCHFTGDSFGVGKRGCTLNEGIASVVKNWDASIDGQGRHYGHLTRAQSQAHCEGAGGNLTWWFEPSGTRGNTQATGGQNGAGTLSIHVTGYANLAAFKASADIYAYVVGNVNGIEIGTQRYTDNGFTQQAPLTDNPNGTQTLTIDGLHVYLWCDSGWRSQYGLGGSGVDVHATDYLYNTNSMGYGIRPADCQNSTVKNCTVIDCGYHAIMFVGGRCNGNTMLSCTLWGGGVNPISANSIGGAFYTAGPTQTGGSWNHNIFGCRAERVVVYGYTLLGVDGEPINFPFDNAVNTTGAPNAVYVTAIHAHGVISHTNNEAGNRITDIEYYRCQFINSGKSDGTNCIGDGFSTSDVNTGAGATATPTTPLISSAYPVRFTECTASGIAKNHLSGNLSAAFVRCRFYLDRHGTAGDTSGAIGSGSGTHAILFEACDFVDTMSHAADARLTIQSTATNDLYFLNCSFYGLGTTANNKQFFNFSSASGYVFARGCILGYRSNVGGTPAIVTTGFGWATTDFNQTVFDMNDCMYFGPVAFVPAQFPGPNDFTKWTSTWNSEGIDQNTINNGTTNPFADVTGASLALTTAAKARRKFLTSHAAAVIGGVRYNGFYGAHGDPPPAYHVRFPRRTPAHSRR